MKHSTAQRKSAHPVITVGWREWLSLPDWGVFDIKAKIDSGAKTSAIHAFNIKEIEIDGKLFVDFNIHPKQHSKKVKVHCRALVKERRKIKSSNGEEAERYIIETTLKLGENSWKIELSLAQRDQLGFRMLLGRQAMRKKCIIDVGASYKTGKPTKQPSTIGE